MANTNCRKIARDDSLSDSMINNKCYIFWCSDRKINNKLYCRFSGMTSMTISLTFQKLCLYFISTSHCELVKYLPDES